MAYLSVVAAGGDDHGARRSQAFVEGWTEKADRFGLQSEVIVVDADARSRNSGMRRARGEFVLATRIGTQFSDELMEFLASQRLQKDRIYRADRFDASRVWAREGVFALTREGLRANAADDITETDSGIHFGAGWFPPSQVAGRTGRFFGKDAEVVLRRVPHEWAALDLEVEPGPGVGNPPAKLQAMDGSGRIAAEWQIGGRTALRFWMPPGERFHLRVPDGGWATPLDLHIFDFRCLALNWVAQRPVEAPPKQRMPRRFLRKPWALPGAMRLLGSTGEDVFGPGIEYWGEGWSYREQDGEETFRWAAEDAELVVRLDGGTGNLAMLVEPGPGVGGERFVLRVRLPDGTVLGRVPVRGPSYVNIPLPEFQEPIVRLFVGPESGARVVGEDARILAFRVFACACAKARSVRRRTRMAPAGQWISVTRSIEPVTVDWPERLRDCQGAIAEMGKPEDLHLNACGEFTLMARDRWSDLRGYPEVDLPQADVDALLCVAAHHAGIVQEVLPYPVHGEDGQTQTGIGNEALWIATQMRRLHAPAIFNPDDWGVEQVTR